MRPAGGCTTSHESVAGAWGIPEFMPPSAADFQSNRRTSMGQYIILAGGMAGLPLLYMGFMWLCMPALDEESSQKRQLLRSAPEYVTLILAEAAFAAIWNTWREASVPSLIFCLLFVMLAAMTVFTMTDYWQKIVPNRLLLVLLMIFAVIMGLWTLRDTPMVLAALPSVLMGFVFCFLCFGVGYIVSRGNMGAGDVKLSLVMGLYLTGNYVVAAVLYGCVAAAVFSLIQLARKKLTRKDKIPFVPFLYIGLIIRYLAG